MNRNWRVTCPGPLGDQVWALKQVLDVDADQARFVHRACRDLASAGIPIPIPYQASSGDTLTLTPEGIWSLAPWIDGHIIPATTWSTAQAETVGELLGRIHQRLAVHLPMPPPRMPLSVTDPHEARQRFDRFRRAAQTARVEGGNDEFDEFTIAVLQEREDLLTRFAAQCPRPGEVTPAGWCHGDFHDLNLLWLSDIEGVSAVLDWDRLSVRPLASEVVRTATLCFQKGAELDLDHVSALVTAYRKVTGMQVEALVDAADRLWWERICDVWQLKRHYDQQNTSCDHLFRSASALIPWWSSHKAAVTGALSAG